MNERTAISSRVYGFEDQEEGFGVRFFAENENGGGDVVADGSDVEDERASSMLVKADIWDGLEV